MLSPDDIVDTNADYFDEYSGHSFVFVFKTPNGELRAVKETLHNRIRLYTEIGYTHGLKVKQKIDKNGKIYYRVDT